MTLPPHLMSDVFVVVVFGLVAIFLLLVAVKIKDLMTRSVDEQQQLNSGNLAVAVDQAAFVIGVAYIIAKVVAHVLGS